MSRFHPDPRQAGFTLIEVMVAFVILATALGALLPQISLALGSAGRLERREHAALLAEAQLDALGSAIPLRPGTVEGRAGTDYWWRVEVCCEPPAAGTTPPMPLHLYQVALTVGWGQAGRTGEIVVHTERLGGR